MGNRESIIMTVLPVSRVRKEFADLTNRVAYTGDRIAVGRRGKPLVAIVSMEDMELLEYLEDKMDVELAKQALKKGKFISLKKLEKELGI